MDCGVTKKFMNGFVPEAINKSISEGKYSQIESNLQKS